MREEEIIAVFRRRGEWFAQFHGKRGRRYMSAFGFAVLPLSYSEKAPAEMVKKSIEDTFPDATVEVD